MQIVSAAKTIWAHTSVSTKIALLLAAAWLLASLSILSDVLAKSGRADFYLLLAAGIVIAALVMLAILYVTYRIALGKTDG